jgi:hypothetical protein
MEVIISALVWGFKKVSEKAVDTAVEISVDLLKKKVLEKAENNADIEDALEMLAKNPTEGRQAMVKEELAAAGLSEDAELIEAAKSLLNATPEGQQILNVQQSQTLGDGAKAAQVSGDSNSVNIG